MGFVNEKVCKHFLQLCPAVEREIIDAGIILIKLWLEVSMAEQDKRFAGRIFDPLRRWKLSPMDITSYERWYDYSRARDAMLQHTDSKHAPWFIVRSDDKRRGRLNCIAHILNTIAHKKMRRPTVKLQKRSRHGAYDDQAILKGRHF